MTTTDRLMSKVRPGDRFWWRPAPRSDGFTAEVVRVERLRDGAVRLWARGVHQSRNVSPFNAGLFAADATLAVEVRD